MMEQATRYLSRRLLHHPHALRGTAEAGRSTSRLHLFLRLPRDRSDVYRDTPSAFHPNYTDSAPRKPHADRCRQGHHAFYRDAPVCIGLLFGGQRKSAALRAADTFFFGYRETSPTCTEVFPLAVWATCAGHASPDCAPLHLLILLTGGRAPRRRALCLAPLNLAPLH